jgi:DNA modification methylase
MAIEALPFAAMDELTRTSVSVMLSALAQAWVLTFCQIEAAPIWREAYEKAGLIYKRTCIWVKPDGMPQYSGDRPGMGYETFVAMHPAGRSKWNGGGRTGVFIYNKNSGGRHEHPTMKPEPLIKELVSLFSDVGDLILDPFVGSGTTLRAAKDLGRKAIGIEIEEKYCEIAARRMAQEVLL